MTRPSLSETLLNAYHDAKRARTEHENECPAWDFDGSECDDCTILDDAVTEARTRLERAHKGVTRASERSHYKTER
jgi:hypothetical protein